VGLLLVALAAGLLAVHLLAGGSGSSGSSTACAISGLPAQAEETVQEIEAGPPYPFGQDGVTSDNREHRLPGEPIGYYREFTVTTPGAPDRGTRRIIAAGGSPTAPAALYYTGNHYASFCHVTGVP
jgi:ribonuclease T1